MKTRRYTHTLNDQRGSVLIVALILAAVVAISLTSYIKLSNTASSLSYRSHYAGVAMNAAESGLEQAMWSINKQKDGDSAAWDGWDTSSGTTARRTFDLGTVSGGGTVSVKVLMSDRNLTTDTPYAIARAIVTPVYGSVIEKWIKISLSQRSLFGNGMVSKKGTALSGNNAYMDSYNSANGAYTPSPSTSNRFPRATAGSAAITLDSFNVGNADIYGYVSVGTSDYTGLKVGSQGKVTGDFDAAGGTIDYSHVATNFTANFDPVDTSDIPAGTNLGTVTSGTLPQDTSTDHSVTDSDGKVTYYYSASSLSLTSSLTILPGYNVVIIVAGGVSMGGDDGAIKVNSTKDSDGVLQESSLNLYVAGNVDITGQGVANTVETTTTTTTIEKVKGVDTAVTTTTTSSVTGRPKDFMLWGTGGDSQTIKVSGNGSLSAVVYAPNAAIEVKGGGSQTLGVYGAYLGNTIKMTGNEGFHYDESLADLDSGEPLGIDKWDEFVSSVDRTSTEAQLMYF